MERKYQKKKVRNIGRREREKLKMKIIFFMLQKPNRLNAHASLFDAFVYITGFSFSTSCS